MAAFRSSVRQPQWEYQDGWVATNLPDDKSPSRKGYWNNYTCDTCGEKLENHRLGHRQCDLCEVYDEVKNLNRKETYVAPNFSPEPVFAMDQTDNENDGCLLGLMIFLLVFGILMWIITASQGYTPYEKLKAQRSESQPITELRVEDFEGKRLMTAGDTLCIVDQNTMVMDKCWETTEKTLELQ